MTDFWKDIKHFKKQEFNCPDFGRNEMSEQFVRLLDDMREQIGEPVSIASGFRCPLHNKAVGGKPDSAHLRGLAADIIAENSAMRYKIVNYAITHSVKRIGIGKSFVHIDISKTLPHPVIWTYYKK